MPAEKTSADFDVMLLVLAVVVKILLSQTYFLYHQNWISFSLIAPHFSLRQEKSPDPFFLLQYKNAPSKEKKKRDAVMISFISFLSSPLVSSVTVKKYFPSNLLLSLLFSFYGPTLQNLWSVRARQKKKNPFSSPF